MNLGAGVAGAGGAAAEEANKYIDQNLAIARAQALADISRTSAVQQHQEIDQYDISPVRQAQMRTNATNATVAAGQAADTSALNTAANAPLNEAKIQQHNIGTRGTMAADVEREGAIDAAKVQKLPPGDKAMQGGRVIAENKNPTMADVWASGQRQNAGDARDAGFTGNIANVNKEAGDLSKAVVEGLQAGTMSMSPRDPANPNDPKDTPYQTWRYTNKRMADLQIERDRLTREYQAERAARRPAAKGNGTPQDGAAPDPLGMRPGGGVSGAPSGNGADKQSVAADFPQVDTKDAQAAAAQLEAYAAKPGTDGYSKQVATQQAQLLRSGSGASQPATATPAPPPAAPGSVLGAAKVPTKGPTWQEVQRRMNGGTPDPTATVDANAPQPTAAAAAAAPAPESSAIAAARRRSGHDAARADSARDVESRRAYLAQLPTMFDKDLATMPPVDFTRKYDPLRSDLDVQRAMQLQRVEAQVR